MTVNIDDNVNINHLAIIIITVHETNIPTIT